MFLSKRKAARAARATTPSQRSPLPLGHLGFAATEGLTGEWEKPAPPPTDWKKVLLLTGLGALSWISTYTGMLELIQANMGEIGLLYKCAIGFAVAMLMLMIIWLLDQLFDRLQPVVRLLFVGGYLFLSLISIGFGFGFYWKFLESRSEATRSAESAVTQVQTALLAAQTRLEQLNATLAQLTTISAQKAIDEREKGNSCPASRPGDGPRRRLRDADASRFGFAQKFIGGRTENVSTDIKTLNADLEKIVNRDASTFDAKTGTRNVFLKDLGRKLDNSVTRFNAFRTDPQLRQFRTDFADRSTKSVFDNGRGGTFSCPDPELQTALRGVVRAIDQLPELEKPEVKAVEGAEAIIEAFRRLTTTISGLATLKLPPTPDELRAAQQRAVQSVRNNAQQRQIMALQPGLGDRDWIPLFIALFVDFCLLLVSVSRPMQGFQWLEHKMGSAQDGPVIKILSRFRDIHRDEEIRDVFEVFRHVVFDVRGVYYAAIPMNGTDPSSVSDLDPEAATEAQLLANLFTSFENDKVYRRVVAPLFTTSYVQKKLRSQGSKFHEAESYRLYRFEKDQWQDWMLSAMMGAAKRVEARKRLEGDVFASDTPKLAAHPEPIDDTQAPSLDDAHVETEEKKAEREAIEAFERDIASEIDETLFNQTYERQEADRKAAIARDRKIHRLHAQEDRTPEHIVPTHLVGSRDESAVQPPAVVNGAFVPAAQIGLAPATPVASIAPAPQAMTMMPAQTPPPSPIASIAANDQTAAPAHVAPVALQSPQAPSIAPRTAPQSIPTVAAPKTVSLLDRAAKARTAHETGRHISQTAQPSTEQIEKSAPNADTASKPEANNEEKKMPAIQVHDALPANLRIQPAPPVAAQPRSVQPRPAQQRPVHARNVQPHAPEVRRVDPRQVQPRPAPSHAAASPPVTAIPRPAESEIAFTALADHHALQSASHSATPETTPLPVSANPVSRDVTAERAPTQLSLLDEPTDLPSILTSRVAPIAKPKDNRAKSERQEPEFGAPAEPFDDQMIENITSWYGREDKRGNRR
ncbi:MAG: hypothetical protein AAFZ01_01510 [Pseudomonadota bacterium]